MKNWNISEQAKCLHQDALVWDNHICLPHNSDEKWMRELKRHKESGANVAGGCHDEDNGLTAFGYQMIEEIDRVGMV